MHLSNIFLKQHLIDEGTELKAALKDSVCYFLWGLSGVYPSIRIKYLNSTLARVGPRTTALTEAWVPNALDERPWVCVPGCDQTGGSRLKGPIAPLGLSPKGSHC